MTQKKPIYYIVFQNKETKPNQVKGVRLFYDRLKAMEAAASWTAENDNYIYILGSGWIE